MTDEQAIHAGAVAWNQPALSRTGVSAGQPGGTRVSAGHSSGTGVPAGQSVARQAAECSLSMAELELELARVAGDNDALRTKCARLAATVDELLARLADRSHGPRPAPIAGHEPTCPQCGAADMLYRLADRGWLCKTCGGVTRLPVARCAAPTHESPATPSTAPEPTCPYCGSADLRRRRHINRGALYCHSCGAIIADAASGPTSIPQSLTPSIPSAACACAAPRVNTPTSCPAHGPLSVENA